MGLTVYSAFEIAMKTTHSVHYINNTRHTFFGFILVFFMFICIIRFVIFSTLFHLYLIDSILNLSKALFEYSKELPFSHLPNLRFL